MFILKYPSFKKLLIFLPLFVSFIPVYAAEQTDTARIISAVPPPLTVKTLETEKIEVFADSYYEFSDVVQGARNGSWKEVTNMVGLAKGPVRGYVSSSQLRRFDNTDYTANFGTYLSMKNAFLHFETGFSWQRTFMYRLQETVEYSHKLYKNLYGQFGYNYRAYPTGDTHQLYPGLIYYFGDSYISANYSASIIEGRGTGSIGTMKLNIALNKYVDWWFGGGYGEWLYDIFGLPANEEYGYIMLSGFTIHITKEVSARIGYSYGTEKPKFLKRNFMYGLSFKF